MTTQRSAFTTIVVFAIVLLAIIGGAVLLLSTRPDPVSITINPPVPTITPEPTGTPGPILVYVTGAVAEPEQTFSLPPGSRVQDAIDAAGGTTEDAVLEQVNLAAILRDGDQVHVPRVIADNPVQDMPLPTPSGGNIIHINSATIDELITLPNIGPGRAEDIIAYRETNGPFTSLEDLGKVSGIGASTLEQLEGLIDFD